MGDFSELAAVGVGPMSAPAEGSISCLAAVRNGWLRLTRVDGAGEAVLLDVALHRIDSVAGVSKSAVCFAVDRSRRRRRSQQRDDRGSRRRRPFTPPDRRHRNYVNNPTDRGLAPGSFVWRPARSDYFYEQPDAFREANKLYHPVKPGVAAWERGKGLSEPKPAASGAQRGRSDRH